MGIWQTIEGDLGYATGTPLGPLLPAVEGLAGLAKSAGSAVNATVGAMASYGGNVSGSSAGTGASTPPKGWAIVTQNAGGIAVWGGIGLVGALLVKNLLRGA